ncbi:hypothetical protein D3C86_2068920 [compost metagenome]
MQQLRVQAMAGRRCGHSLAERLAQRPQARFISAVRHALLYSSRSPEQIASGARPVDRLGRGANGKARRKRRRQKQSHHVRTSR